MIGGGNSNRKLADWLNSWLEYSEVLSSPEIFRKWAGIGMLAAAAERRLWVRTKGANLYPNLYLVLVGPPGVGKSAVLSQSERILRTLSNPTEQIEIHVAPSSVTTASLIDSMEAAVRKILRPTDTPNFIQFNALTVFASELGVFMPAYDTGMMNTLTKLYDGEFYEERRRTSSVKHVRIDNPQLNIIGGTTPSYLNSFLPDGAWDQGFTSRTILVYNGEPINVPLFGEEAQHDHLATVYKDLVHDLKIVARLYGKLEWEPSAAAAITAWANAGTPPVPEHGKLLHYNTRRLAHVIKLTMIAAISRANDLKIIDADFARAREWLIEAEDHMGDIFTSMGISGDARAMEDTFHYVFKMFAKERKPISEHRVVSFLKNKVPSHNVMRVIDIMERSKYLIPDISTGMKAYRPGSRGD